MSLINRPKPKRWPTLLLIVSLFLISACSSESLPLPSAGNAPRQDAGTADAAMSKIASGQGHGCAIRGDGTLWCWGANASGQVGDGTTVEKTAPVQIGTLSTWTSVSAVGDHTCGLRADGSLWCWGKNADGQIGDGTTTDRTSPVQVGTANTWSGVSLGQAHSCGIRSDNTLWCWGDNASGQLGDGTKEDPKNPTNPPPQTTPKQLAETNWLHVSAGNFHTCGTRIDGTLWCWGENFDGQVGHVPATDQLLPLRVGTDADWTALSSGGGHTCAMKSDKSLWCWGDNLFGQLGDRFRIDRSSPFAIKIDADLAFDSAWRAVSAGGVHTCAIRSDGSLWCWGSNERGRLGNGVKTDTLAPLQVGGYTDWVGVSSGDAHTCGLRTDGSVMCWGDNANGRLGLGTAANKTAPTQIGTATNWSNLSAGNHSSCATRTEGTLYCWGENGSGQLGDGSTNDRIGPTQIGTASNWQALSMGDIHSCGLKSDGAIACWGDNYFGQLGYETVVLSCPTNDPNAQAVDPGCPNNDPDPPKVGPDARRPNAVGLSNDWAAISASSGFLEGRGHSCAVKTNGTLWCWGDNSAGQIGIGTTDKIAGPIQVGNVATWGSLSTAGVHSCATRTDGTLWCWGINFTGQVGDGTVADKLSPTVVDFFVLNSANNVLKFNDGGIRTATLTAGSYSRSRLATEIKSKLESANGGPDTYTVTYNATNLKFTITNNATNTNVIDFLFEDVGTTASDVLGFNATDHSAVPVGGSITSDKAKTIPQWSSFKTGDLHSCGIKTGGTLWCWGNNFFGQIGDNTKVNRLSPVQIGTASDWARVTIGGFHTCGVKTSGSLWCWGDNAFGQSGDGTKVGKRIPTQVGLATDWQFPSAGINHTCAAKVGGTLWCWGDNASGQLGDGSAWQASPAVLAFP